MHALFLCVRWDLPHEVDQLKWLPGLPGEGVDAEGALSSMCPLQSWRSLWAPLCRGLSDVAD